MCLSKLEWFGPEAIDILIGQIPASALFWDRTIECVNTTTQWESLYFRMSILYCFGCSVLLDLHKQTLAQRDEYYAESETLRRSSTPRLVSYQTSCGVVFIPKFIAITNGSTWWVVMVGVFVDCIIFNAWCIFTKFFFSLQADILSFFDHTRLLDKKLPLEA